MKTITTMSAAISLIDKIENITPSDVKIELHFNNVPLSEMEILSRQERLKINITEGQTYHYMMFTTGVNNFYFWNKIIKN